MTGDTQIPPFNLKRSHKFRKLSCMLTLWANTELFATWLSGTLSTITSDVFAELIICITRVTYSFHAANENQVRQWNSVDDVLDRLSLCEDVTLVVRPQSWVIDD